MKTLIFESIATLFILTSITSCNNEETASPPPPPGLGDFYYAEGGGPITAVPNPSADASTATIFARNDAALVIEMNLSTLVVGAYPINATNRFRYYQPGSPLVWTGFTGTIYITANEFGKLSGFFDINSGDGNAMINQVNGSFSDITINP